jgi:hypothetical protein
VGLADLLAADGERSALGVNLADLDLVAAELGGDGDAPGLDG